MDASTVSVCPLTVLAWRLGSLSVQRLWWRYVVLGGTADPGALAAYLDGRACWPVQEHRILAIALNEQLWDVAIASLAPLRPPGA